MQMDEGGAVRACRLIVSSVLSGSSEIIRTVWSSQPTALTKHQLIKLKRIERSIHTKNGVRCLPSGTSPILSANTVLPIAFIS